MALSALCIRLTLPHVRERCHLADRIGASGRCFNTFHDEMLAEELCVFFARVEVMRCQYSGQDRRAGFQLHLHQAGDDSLRDELVPVDAAIHHKPCGNNSCVAATLSEQLRVQRDFEGAGNFVEIDIVAAESLCLDGAKEGRFALIDNGLGFQLVPWIPSLERELGRQVNGIAGPGGVEWSLGRKRDLSL